METLKRRLARHQRHSSPLAAWTRLQKYFPEKAAVKAPGGSGRAPLVRFSPRGAWRCHGAPAVLTLEGVNTCGGEGSKVEAGMGEAAQADNTVWGGGFSVGEAGRSQVGRFVTLTLAMTLRRRRESGIRLS